jgi:hypothetical protein
MNVKMLKAAFAGLVLSVSGVANAGLITETQIQTINFQDFTFNFNVNDWVQGSGSTLLLEIQGDFTSSTSSENFELLVEGINYGTRSRNNSDSFVSYTRNTALLTNLFSFNIANTNSFLVNDIFSFNVNFDSGVHVSFGNDGIGSSNSPYVKATYTYNSVAVPEPSTLAIFALGLMGLASRRFKKQ